MKLDQGLISDPSKVGYKDERSGLHPGRPFRLGRSLPPEGLGFARTAAGGAHSRCDAFVIRSRRSRRRSDEATPPLHQPIRLNKPKAILLLGVAA